MLKIYMAWIPVCFLCCSIGCSDSLDEPSPNRTDGHTKSNLQISDSSETASDLSDTASEANDVRDVASEKVADAISKSNSDESNELIEITFDDIELPMKEDMVFRPQLMLTEQARELDGKRVRISGFMYSAVSKFRGIKNFIMVKNTECKYGSGGRADHLINVMMNEGESTIYRTDSIAIEGTIKINPFTGLDGNTWSIYELACERVEKFRPRR